MRIYYVTNLYCTKNIVICQYIFVLLQVAVSATFLWEN